MIPKRAYEKALANGWKGTQNNSPHWQVIAFDASFWKAVGLTEEDSHEFYKLAVADGETDNWWNSKLGE